MVRLGLLETLFEMMYDQKRELGHDETQWPHRIMSGRQIASVEEGKDALSLRLRPAIPGDIVLEADGLVEREEGPVDASAEEVLDVDLIVAATGYRRTAHLDMLKDAWKLLPQVEEDAVASKPRSDQWSVQTEGGEKRVMEVSRDYKVKFAKGAVTPDSGVYLQGCCEGTHGVSLGFPVSLALCFSVTDISRFTAE